MKYLLILFFFPLSVVGQEELSFNTLVNEANHYLNQYSRLSPYGREYYSILSFKFSQKESEDLISEATYHTDYDAILNQNKDSILGRYMIDHLQEKITHRLNQIINHSEFQKNDIEKLMNSNELSVVVSEDKKLYNFYFDEKTGGTYRSQVSIMHYTEFVPENSAQVEDFQTFFSSDGYSGIYTLNTDEGVKYVLTSFVRGCSLCFGTSVRLISFNNNCFKEDFVYSVDNRDYEDGVSYDHETKTIHVDYSVDDLTPYCYCSEATQENESNGSDKDIFNYNCHCRFIFNGKTFSLAEEAVKKTIHKERALSEILSFKIAKNQKEVKVFVVNDATLYYVFLRPDKTVEFSYPLKSKAGNTPFRINQKENKLTFNNGDVVYQIYVNQGQNKPIEVGILVTVGGKTYDLKGDPKSMKGTLINAELEKYDNVYKE